MAQIMAQFSRIWQAENIVIKDYFLSEVTF